MVGTKDNKILVNRGKYVDILDTFGNILKHNIKFENEPISNTYDFQNVKFFYDGDTLYLKREKFLYLYKEEEESFELVATITKSATSFGVNQGIFLIGNKNEIGINISFDKGKTWELRNNGIEDKEGVTKGSNYFTVTPYDQNVIYLAVNIASKDANNDPIGALYVSEDYGENWKIVPELANLKTINIMRYADFVYLHVQDKDDYDYNPTVKFWWVKYNKDMKKASLIDHTPGTGEVTYFSPGIPRIMKNFRDWHNEHPLYYGAGIIGSNLYAVRKKVVETPDVAVRLADKDIENLKLFCYVNGAIYASSGRDIWKLDEIGRKWDNIYKDKVQQNSYISTYGVYGDTIIAKANLSEPESYSGFLISNDNGDTWEKLNTPNPVEYLYSPTSSNGEITSVRFIGDKLYYFISNNGFVISDNRGTGELYRLKFEDLIIDTAIGQSSIPFIFSHENNRIIPTKYALAISRDGGESFHFSLDPVGIYKIYDIQEHNGKYYLLTNALTLYRSDDLGETWKPFIKSKNHFTYNRQLRNFSFTDDGLWLNCGGFLKELGLFYIKNEDFEDADTVDIYSEKLVRVDDSKSIYDVTLASIVVDSHLIVMAPSTYGVYYMKLDGRNFPQPLVLMNSPNMEKQKIGFLDTNSQYIFVGQPEGLYRCPRSYLQNSSVSEKLPFEPVLLYPNPGSDFVNIILNKAEEYKYIMLDNSGREVGSGTIENNMIDIRQYPVGSYIIKVSSQSDSFTTKFIKQ